MKLHTPPAPPPNRLPVLTEVVDVSDHERTAAPMAAVASPTTGQPAAVPVANPVAELNEDAVVQRVLVDLHRQIDLMFEHRLRESLAPALARITDTLVREVRAELGVTLREMVERAVVLELSRHRRS